MVMTLFEDMCRPDPQYSTVSVREAKYTRLEYKIKLSRLHTVDSLFSISFFEKHPFSNTGPRARKKPRDPR
jgi:hypothetical protein